MLTVGPAGAAARRRRPAGPVEAVTRVRLPKTFNARNPQSRRDLASTLRAASRTTRPAGAPTSRRRTTSSLDLRRRDARPPVPRLPRPRGPRPLGRALAGGCAGRPTTLERRIEGRTNIVARTFDRVCDVLAELGYLDGTTTRHRRTGRAPARRLYTELDLLAAECLRAGVWGGLDGRARRLLSALIHESRRRRRSAATGCPAERSRTALDETVRLWGELEDARPSTG